MKLVDLYDENLVKTSKVVPYKSEIPDGYYHITVDIWIINKNNEVLLLKNSVDYSRIYPGSWCSISSGVLTDESYDDSIKRIINEKIGLDISYDKIFISDPIKRDPHKYAYVTCILKAEVDISKIKFKDGHSTKAMFVNKNKLLDMCENGEVASHMVSRINNEVIKYLD